MDLKELVEAMLSDQDSAYIKSDYLVEVLVMPKFLSKS